MKSEKKIRRVLRLINNYLMFFLMVAFVISCCTMLFVTHLTEDLGIEPVRENISSAAKITFLNVLLLSLLFLIVDKIRRKFTVEKPYLV